MGMDILELIQVELLLIIAVTYVLGIFLKNSKKIPDWYIPFILLAFAVVFSILYKAIMLREGFVAETILGGFLYGILIAGTTVYGNQLIKQGTEREE